MFSRFRSHDPVQRSLAGLELQPRYGLCVVLISRLSDLPTSGYLSYLAELNWIGFKSASSSQNIYISQSTRSPAALLNRALNFKSFKLILQPERRPCVSISIV